MQTATSTLPHKNSISVFTKEVDIIIAERDFGQEGSTEVDINHGQVSIEITDDGMVLFSAYEGSLNAVTTVFESLEDFIDAVLQMGVRA